MCFRFLQVAWNFWRTGELPHHDHGHVDGLEEETPPVDVDVYGMDDNLHPHDLKHTMVGDNRRKADVATDPDRRKVDLGGEPK
jgi:C4-dicarboxylate transporter DctQ subunit